MGKKKYLGRPSKAERKAARLAFEQICGRMKRLRSLTTISKLDEWWFNRMTKSKAFRDDVTKKLKRKPTKRNDKERIDHR